MLSQSASNSSFSDSRATLQPLGLGTLFVVETDEHRLLFASEIAAIVIIPGGRDLVIHATKLRHILRDYIVVLHCRDREIQTRPSPDRLSMVTAGIHYVLGNEPGLSQSQLPIRRRQAGEPR